MQETIGFHFANKLSRAHVNFINNKMKVKLAIQTFSSSVADAMEALDLLHVEDFKGCASTIDFI